MAATCLLTLLAVEWIVSPHVPVANGTSWLDDLISFCGTLIIMVCVETALAAYMLTKKGHAPFWMKYVVIVSLPLKWIAFFVGIVPDDDDADMRLDEEKLLHSFGGFNHRDTVGGPIVPPGLEMNPINSNRTEEGVNENKQSRPSLNLVEEKQQQVEHR